MILVESDNALESCWFYPQHQLLWRKFRQSCGYDVGLLRILVINRWGYAGTVSPDTKLFTLVQNRYAFNLFGFNNYFLVYCSFWECWWDTLGWYPNVTTFTYVIKHVLTLHGLDHRISLILFQFFRLRLDNQYGN